MYIVAVAFTLVFISIVWLVARKLAWPRDGICYDKTAGWLSGTAGMPVALLAFSLAYRTDDTMFATILVVVMLVGACIAVAHGYQAGEDSQMKRS